MTLDWWCFPLVEYDAVTEPNEGQTAAAWVRRESTCHDSFIELIHSDTAWGLWLPCTRVHGDQRWDKQTTAAQNKWHLEPAPEHLSPHSFFHHHPTTDRRSLAINQKITFTCLLNPLLSGTEDIWALLCNNKVWKKQKHHAIERLLFFPYLYSE